MVKNGILKLTFFLVFLIFLFACNYSNLNENYSNSSTVAYNLIQICVDSAISKFPEANTRNYVVNLTGMQILNKDGIDKYLEIKNSNLPTTHDDSVIITGQDGRSYMKQSMLINFIKIESRSDKYVDVELNKIKTNKEIVRLTLKLERQKSGYKVVYSNARR